MSSRRELFDVCYKVIKSKSEKHKLLLLDILLLFFRLSFFLIKCIHQKDLPYGEKVHEMTTLI